MRESLSPGDLEMMHMILSGGVQLLGCFLLFQGFLIPVGVSCKTRIAGPCRGLENLFNIYAVPRQTNLRALTLSRAFVTPSMLPKKFASYIPAKQSATNRNQ